MSQNNSSACIIAAPHSHSGKTLITISLLRHCANHNIPVMPGKVGPDYIDPQFHAKAARTQQTVNLDSWAMRPDSLHAMQNLAEDRLLLIEGAMGLYDGAGHGFKGSSASLAEMLNIPIIFILPVKGQSRSICASLKGFIDYCPRINIAGVILNGVSSERHQAILCNALQEDFHDLSILGALPFCDDWHLPSRHLGLTQPDNLPEFDKKLDKISADIMQYIDFPLLEKILKEYNYNSKINNEKNQSPLLELQGVNHIAIAYDEACRFIYPAQLQLWQQQNIHISFFSILKNEVPSEHADMIFLPGGYPELFASQISQAKQFMQGLYQAEKRGAWIYGECGGYMILGKSLIDKQGNPHQMAGLLNHSTNIAQAKRHLGYRICSIHPETPFKQACFTAHEFHYSTEQPPYNQTKLFHNIKNASEEKMPDGGGIKGRVMGSYLHLIDAVSA